MKLQTVKVSPEEIMRSFTKENEETGLLSNYFYVENFQLKKMDTCEKFARAFGKSLQMSKRALPGQMFNEYDLVDYELTEVSAKYVANRLEYDNEIFYAKLPLDKSIYPTTDCYELIENMGYNAKFFKVGK